MIDIFNNKYQIKNRTNNSITYFIMLLVIISLIIINIFLNYQYYINDSYTGYINENYKLVLYVDDISNINKYKLYVENKNYKFKVNSISDEYFIIDGKKCYQIELDINLDKDLLIKNNIIEVILQKGKTTVYQKIKKGMKEWIS